LVGEAVEFKVFDLPKWHPFFEHSIVGYIAEVMEMFFRSSRPYTVPASFLSTHWTTGTSTLNAPPWTLAFQAMMAGFAYCSRSS
jgi:hypothetical protein